MKALVAVSGRSSTVPEVSNVRVISLTSPVIPVSEYSIVDLNKKGPSECSIVGLPPGLSAADQGCKNERRYKLCSHNTRLGAQWNTLYGCIRQLCLHAACLCHLYETRSCAADLERSTHENHEPALDVS